MESGRAAQRHEAWNKGKLVGQKAPFKLKEIWAIRIRLQMQERLRELALFDLGIDSKLRACDLVRLRVRDVCHGDRVAARAMVLQQKTQHPVQFEITAQTREALETWIKRAGLKSDRFYSPAVSANHRILAPGSTRESSITGSQKLVLIRIRMGHIRCAGQKRH